MKVIVRIIQKEVLITYNYISIIRDHLGNFPVVG
jgi:hypothetical protein